MNRTSPEARPRARRVARSRCRAVKARSFRAAADPICATLLPPPAHALDRSLDRLVVERLVRTGRQRRVEVAVAARTDVAQLLRRQGRVDVEALQAPKPGKVVLEQPQAAAARAPLRERVVQDDLVGEPAAPAA